MCDTTKQTLTPEQIEANAIAEWKTLKQNRNLVEVAKFRAECPDVVSKEEVDELFSRLRDEELQGMLTSPAKFSRSHIESLVSCGAFSYDELLKFGLITEDSWKRMQINRDFLPDLPEFQKGMTELQQPPAGTDIYFFGMPTSGKTSLLMGIAAANGQGYTIDMRTNGGPYAAALRQFAQSGLMVGRTNGKFVTTISGRINRDFDSDKVKSYPINLVEMSGEEFALRIAETKETSMANMGTGVTNLLRNDNRKVFFILVDASKPMVKVSYLDHEIDEDGEISKHVRSRYISQLDILDKFAVLISLPENREIMNKVDAIHFIVTKSDALGTAEERDEKAHEMVQNHYLSVVEQLRYFCQHTKRINRASDYEPQIYTYSLGKFYVGDVFDFDNADTLKIVDAIREVSAGGIKQSWRKFCSSFRPQ